MIRLPLYGGDRRAAVERAEPLERDPDCRRCPLGERTVIRSRCLPADGQPGGLLVIGEGPTADDDRSGRPMVGTIGARVRREVAKHWRGPVAYALATGCAAPREGRDRLMPKAVAACRGFLRQVLDEVEPTRVVLLGPLAGLSVLGRSVAPLSVRGGYGWLWRGGSPVPAYHLLPPGMTIHNRTHARWFEEDLRLALTRPDPAPPPWDAECRVVEDEGDAREAARELAGARAWASVDCETFGRLADPDFRAFSVAVCARGSDSPWVWPLDALEDPGCRDSLQTALDSCDVTGQNFKFDRQALARGPGLDPPPEVVDTRLVRRLIDPDAAADLETMAELVGLGGHKDENLAEVDRAKRSLMEWARQRPDGPRRAQAHESVDDLMASAWEREAEQQQTDERRAAKAAGQTVPRLRQEVRAPARWWTAPPGWWTEDVRARLGEYRHDSRDTSDKNPDGWALDSSGRPKFWKGVDPEVYAYALVSREVSWRYVALDALTTARVAESQERTMDEQPRIRRVWEVAVRPASPAIARLESNGVLVSREQIDAFAGLLRIKLLGVGDRLKPYDFNPDSAPQLRKLLFERLGLTPVDTTDSGLESTDKDALRALRGQHPIIEDLLEWRRLTKLLGTYADGMRSHIQADGRIHASFNIDGARTGRLSCVAKGTLVEVVRDVSKAPKGVPIEDVRAGDLAYSYDADRKLCLRRVKWAGKTGTRELVRLHWLGTGRQHQGFIDLTPEHPVRLVSGEYVRADELRPGQRLLAMSRGLTLGYARLWAHGVGEINREHRFIYEQIHGDLPAHVHHRDENKLNNLPGNLEGLSAEEHTSQHARELANRPGRREQMAEQTRMLWREGKLKPRYGRDCWSYRDLSREEAERLLAGANWSILRAAQAGEWDFDTLKKKLVELGFDLAEMKRRNRAGRREQIQAAAAHARAARAAKRAGGEFNHIVLRVERLRIERDVYDMEIEETHNFIAGEICVHNSSGPNMQTAPKPGTDEGKMFRDVFVAPPGYVLVEGDLSQIELRVAAFMSGDQEMIALFKSGADFHMQVARSVSKIVWGIPPEAVTDHHRSLVKTFVFGIVYAMTDEGVVERTGCTLQEAAAVRESVLGRFAVLQRWLREQVRAAHRQGGAYTWWDGDPKFRFRPLPMLGDADSYRRKNAENAAVNGPVQGTANEFCLQSLVALDRWLLESAFPAHTVLTVHDSILAEVREDRVADYVGKLDSIFTGWNSMGVPLAADYKVGRAWGSCEKYKLT